jgi:HD-like signal output (HDOD) protein
VGAYLLGLWGLPMPIVEAVAHHHAPSRVVQSEFGPIAVVHIAVALANGAGVDEALLRRLGRADALPGWRIAASQQWNEEAA